MKRWRGLKDAWMTIEESTLSETADSSILQWSSVRTIPLKWSSIRTIPLLESRVQYDPIHLL